MYGVVRAGLCLLLLLGACLSTEQHRYEGQVVKGNRNALFLVQQGQRLQFPDFYTFTHMGFNLSVIKKIPDPELHSIPLGTPIKPIAVYRPDDFMYHRVCTDPDRLVRASPCRPQSLVLSSNCCLCYADTRVGNSAQHGQSDALPASAPTSKAKEDHRNPCPRRQHHCWRISERICAYFGE